MIPQRVLIWFVVLLSLYPSVAGDVWATVVTEWVVVGDPGNAELTVEQADGTSGYGRVDYEYQVGKYEVTNAEYTEFLNAVAATDTNELYWNLMGSQTWGGILRSGFIGNYTYSLKPNMGNKPVNYVTWQDAARFTNWLHNGQPVGIQDASTTEDGSYTFTDLETAGPRNPGAQVFIPNEHEWMKAAFYQPGAATLGGDEWWLYPTASDDLPQPAVAEVNGDVRNPGAQIVNFFHGAGWNGAIEGNVVTVGGSGNTTYYGAADMGGNVFEWTTADPNKPDPFDVGPYIVRGASFQNTQGHMRNDERNLGPLSGGGHQHSFASKNNGFRLASYLPSPIAEIPEPNTLVLILIGIFGVARLRRKANWFAVLLAASLIPVFADRVAADTFGNDANLFNIAFVTIGDPGNAPDTSGDPNPDLPGSVSYGYRIGKYEVSESMIARANAEGGLNIQYIIREPDKPVTQVTWIEAITFVNWLNTSSGNQAAYKLSGNIFALWEPGDAGYDSANPYRNSSAKYFLPSADEWYKAAFFDPTTGNYFDYATGSNTPPEPVESGTNPNTAVYGQKFNTTPPADITQAGGLSPYGTMAQSGNVFEMEETDFDLVNDAVSSPRGARGGNWAWSDLYPGFLSKSYRNSINPDGQINYLGFRVASKALIADFDFDGDVDSDDLAKWNNAFGTTADGDADGDGDSDGDDFLAWQRNIVSSTILTGDFDFDGDVDGYDLARWNNAYGTTADGDADGDGDSDGADFLAWQRNFDGNVSPLASSLASVPEPSGVVLSLLAIGFAIFSGRRSK